MGGLSILPPVGRTCRFPGLLVSLYELLMSALLFGIRLFKQLFKQVSDGARG